MPGILGIGGANHGPGPGGDMEGAAASSQPAFVVDCRDARALKSGSGRLGASFHLDMASIAHDSASVATALRDLEPLKGARAISLIGDHGGSNSEFVKMGAAAAQRVSARLDRQEGSPLATRASIFAARGTPCSVRRTLTVVAPHSPQLHRARLNGSNPAPLCKPTSSTSTRRGALCRGPRRKERASSSTTAAMAKAARESAKVRRA